MTTTEIHDTFNAVRDSVYGWAYRIVGNHHDAMDVTQDVFVKWWQVHRGSAAPVQPIGWLRRVTINHSINTQKARSRLAPAADFDRASPDVSQPDTDRREVGRVAAEAMSEMSEQQRAVLFAKVYDGCTFAQVAEQMELAIPTVKTHYVRALKVVRGRFKEAGIVAGDLL